MGSPFELALVGSCLGENSGQEAQWGLNWPEESGLKEGTVFLPP